ncbi:Fur family transcriptional regulator [Caldicellulosiruptoraceae bacterium PP1]
MDEKQIDEIKEQLKQKGYKLTTQRRIILDSLIDNQEKHLSIEEIYDIVKKRMPEIGLATVYRTLMLLNDLNVVNKIDLDDGCSRFELNEEDRFHKHHHLICINCGKIEEAEEDLLEILEAEIEKKNGFKVVDHIVKFYGLCSECQKRSE